MGFTDRILQFHGEGLDAHKNIVLEARRGNQRAEGGNHRPAVGNGLPFDEFRRLRVHEFQRLVDNLGKRRGEHFRIAHNSLQAFLDGPGKIRDRPRADHRGRPFDGMQVPGGRDQIVHRGSVGGKLLHKTRCRPQVFVHLVPETGSDLIDPGFLAHVVVRTPLVSLLRKRDGKNRTDRHTTKIHSEPRQRPSVLILKLPDRKEPP